MSDISCSPYGPVAPWSPYGHTTIIKEVPAKQVEAPPTASAKCDCRAEIKDMEDKMMKMSMEGDDPQMKEDEAEVMAGMLQKAGYSPRRRRSRGTNSKKVNKSENMSEINSLASIRTSSKCVSDSWSKSTKRVRRARSNKGRRACRTRARRTCSTSTFCLRRSRLCKLPTR